MNSCHCQVNDFFNLLKEVRFWFLCTKVTTLQIDRISIWAWFILLIFF